MENEPWQRNSAEIREAAKSVGEVATASSDDRKEYIPPVGPGSKSLPPI